MRLTTPTALTAAALATALAAAAPTTAHASSTFGENSATYEATLTGSQVTTWNYNDPDDPNDPCDSAAQGNGDQTVRFKTKKKFRITFLAPPKKEPDFFNSDGRPIIVTKPVQLPVELNAERGGEFDSKHEFPRECVDGDNGGGVDETAIRPKDCGSRTGTGSVSFFFHSGRADDLVVPIPGRQNGDKDWLKLDGSGESYGASGGSLGGTYENCPMLLTQQAENHGVLYTSPAKLSEKRIFATKKGRSLLASGDTSAKVGGGFVSGKTLIAWNLRMKRVK